MQQFPYIEILRRAYQLTLQHSWLWWFGLFLSGITRVNFGGASIWHLNSAEQIRREIEGIQSSIGGFFESVPDGPIYLAFFIFVVLFLLLVMLFLQGLAKASVVWSVGQWLKHEQDPKSDFVKPHFRSALQNGKRFAWRIVGLQIFVSLVFLFLLSVYLAPVIYLFSIGVFWRGLVLSLLGLVIFIPAAIVFGFIHLYGPIFIVLYDQRIGRAVVYSFNLMRGKLKESVLLAIFLMGLGIFWIAIILFSLILLSIPFILFGLLAAWLNNFFVISILAFGAVLLAVFYVIVFEVAFAIFHNITWVLAVNEMVKTRRFEQEAKAYTAETAETV